MAKGKGSVPGGMRYDSRGREIPDRTPLAMPLRFRRKDPTADVRRLIREEFSRRAEAEGQESFEDADDFDIADEDELPLSPHEMTEMQEEVPRDFYERSQKERENAFIQRRAEQAAARDHRRVPEPGNTVPSPDQPGPQTPR